MPEHEDCIVQQYASEVWHGVGWSWERKNGGGLQTRGSMLEARFLHVL